jgi:hypothetical protein
MAFNIEDFRSNINAHNEIAKANQFQVRIYPPTGLMADANYSNVFGSSSVDVTKALSFQAESAELPGRTLNTITPKIYGVPFRTPATTDYQEISVTFISTGTFWERKFFDGWLDYIQPRDTFNFKYRDNYTTRIEIYQYNQFDPNSYIYAVSLEEAYPTIVAPQALNWTGDEQHKLTVTFSYIRWASPHLPETIISPAQNSSAIDTSNSGNKTPAGSGRQAAPVGQIVQNIKNPNPNAQ